MTSRRATPAFNQIEKLTGLQAIELLQAAVDQGTALDESHTGPVHTNFIGETVAMPAHGSTAISCTPGVK